MRKFEALWFASESNAQTIKVVANEGLEKIIAKASVGTTGINEVDIYKFFNDKDDLLSATFATLDDELCVKVLCHMSVMHISEMEYKLRCHYFFSVIRQFLIGNQEKCLVFIRY